MVLITMKGNITICITIAIGIIGVVVYQVIDERLHTILKPPIIQDVFKQYRDDNNITIYEMNELFVTFYNPNLEKSVCNNNCIIFYTINNSDPRIYGIPYDDEEQSEIGISLPISRVHNVYKPIKIHVVVGKLGLYDQIIWSNVETKEFWNPNHLNHRKYGAGFSQTPQILSDTHTIGDVFVIRVWPKRLTDIVKCVCAKTNDSPKLKKKKIFWRDISSSKSVNVSRLHLISHTYIDMIFDSFANWNEFIYVRCSTSTESESYTSKNTEYSSMLMPTIPKHTQLLPTNTDMLGKISS